LETLIAKQPGTKPHIFLPLNTTYCIPRSLRDKLIITELDWWEDCEIKVDHVGTVRLSCLPAQHFTGRGLFDRMQSLWASWAVEGLIPSDDRKQAAAKVSYTSDRLQRSHR
jgi:N-acyl-phosphatidylethanolamine-hydrolysing phospholipase D